MQNESRGSKNLMDVVEKGSAVVRYRNIWDGYFVGDKFKDINTYKKDTYIENYHGYSSKEEYLMYNDYEYDEEIDFE